MTTSLYLDRRKVLKSGKYAVKVQVASKEGKRWKQILLSTGVELLDAEWALIQSGSVRSNELRKKWTVILAAHAKADGIAKSSPFISLDTFRMVYSGSASGDHLNVQELYRQQIERLAKRGQYGTSVIYKSAAKILLNKYGSELTLNVIDKDFLDQLEHELTIAPSTIGIYLRTIRTIFNQAMDRRLISRELYPFGSKGYKPPMGTSFKRALTEAEKNKLIAYKPKSVEERKALAIWKVSYYCNGMNAADLALLSRDAIQGDVLTYVRKKTARTERKGKPQVAVIRPEIKKILAGGSGKFVFGVLNGKETAEQERKKIMQWTKTTNKYLKRIGDRLKLSCKLTTYVARHTAATMLLRAGADLVYIRDALGHSSTETTENYLGSLDLDGARKMTAKL